MGLTNSRVHTYTRIILLTIFIVFEGLILSLLVDAQNLPKTTNLSFALSQSGHVLRWIIISVGVVSIVTIFSQRSNPGIHLYDQSWGATSVWLAIHLVVFGLLLTVTISVFSKHNGYGSKLEILWILLVLLTFLSWCRSVAPLTNWKHIIKNNCILIVGAGTFGLATLLLGIYFQHFWLSLTSFTLGSTRLLLEPIYGNIVYDSSLQKIGVENFWVYVDATCSGIEGIALALMTTSIYIYLSRHHLKLPQALVLVPLACLISILLNIVRIFALIIIGAEISPSLAIGGFHSVAGWIASVVVALIIIFWFSSWDWLQKPTAHKTSTNSLLADNQVALAILIPFVLFLATSLVSQIFINGFDFLYPAKAIVTAIGLIYFWKYYGFTIPNKTVESTVIGLFVAITWILLVPENLPYDTEFATRISDLSTIASFSWVLFRCIGFLLIAPILEELVFRGYLLCRLSGQSIELKTQPAFTIFSFLATASLFGFIHSAWLAGFVAGILFALVRYRAGTISSCILAHSVANILVGIWAIYSNQWSLI